MPAIDELRAVLDRHHTGVELWWRDDDAADDVPSLHRLVEIAARWRVPVAFAVIPKRMTAETATLIGGLDGVAIFQHGWSHDDHGGKIELDDRRELHEVRRELEAGRRVLEAAFCDRYLPVIVPPWHRIGAAILDALPSWGFRGISAEGGPPSTCPSLHVELDLMRWHPTAEFRGEREVLDALCALLSRPSESHEPIGLVSHHRTATAEQLAFISELMRAVAEHPAARWVSPRELFLRAESRLRPPG